MILLCTAGSDCLLGKGLVNGKEHRSRRVDDDYSYYNDYEVMKIQRRGRQNTDWRSQRRGRGHRNATTRSANAQTRYLLVLCSVSVLLLIATDERIR